MERARSDFFNARPVDFRAVALVFFEIVPGKETRVARHTLVAPRFGENRGGGDAVDVLIAFNHGTVFHIRKVQAQSGKLIISVHQENLKRKTGRLRSPAGAAQGELGRGIDPQPIDQAIGNVHDAMKTGVEANGRLEFFAGPGLEQLGIG